MLRITRTDREGTTTLLLEGRLTRRERTALDEACADCIADRGAVVIDLAGIGFVDAAGAAALRAWRERRVELTGCSPYVRELLQGELV
ncbi:MAG TPA: STAS domain-containing protein [Myxococcota bacterium]|nr:STAS domain-containing protein [Myxococcota bacterium]